MRIGLKAMREHCRMAVGSPRGRTRWNALVGERPDLAAYSEAEDALRALGRSGWDNAEEKELLTRLLLTMCREPGDQLFGNLLVLAYYPMLSNLRRKLRCASMEEDDLDQLVAISFLQVTKTLPLERHPDRLPMYLRQRTKDAVINELKRHQKESSTVFAADEVYGEQPSGDSFPETRSEESPLDLLESIAQLERLCHGRMSEKEIRLLTATVVRKERVSDYVKRVERFSNRREYELAYQRVKRQRHRTLMKIRDLLAEDPCPRNGDLSLCLDDAGSEDQRRGRRSKARLETRAGQLYFERFAELCVRFGKRPERNRGKGRPGARSFVLSDEQLVFGECVMKRESSLESQLKDIRNDEREIIASLIHKMKQGHRARGPWNLKRDNRNLRREALSNVYDALQFCAAELVKLSRGHQLEGDSRRVYVCHPYSKISRNMKEVKLICRKILDEGNIPIAPHLYLPQFIDESADPELARTLSLQLLEMCEEIRVCGSVVTDKMREEMEHALEHDIPFNHLRSEEVA